MPPVRAPKGKLETAKKGTLKRLLKILFKNYRFQLIFSAICIVLYSLGNIASSVFMSVVTNTLESATTGRISPSQAWSSMITTLIVIGIIYIIGMASAYGYNYTMSVTSQRFLNTLRKQMFNHMESLPIKYFDTHPRGDIMSLYTNDIDTIRQLVSQAIPIAFQAGFTVIGAIAAMLLFSPILTVLVIIGSMAMFMNAKTMGGKSAKYFVKQQIATGKVEGNIEESIKGLKVIKVFSHEEKSIEDFDKINDQLCKDSTSANEASNILAPINGNIGNILYVILIVVGVLFIIQGWEINPGLQLVIGDTFSVSYGIGKITYSIIFFFLIACRTFSNNVNNFTQQITFITMGQAGASRIFDLLDEQSETDSGYVTLVNVIKHEDGTLEETSERTRTYAWKHPHKADGTITYTELKGDIVIDDVDFGYNQDQLILHNVSIYAHPGQRIAFVGATGAGKTTITNLINRFYDIADGKIRYDGININKIKKDDLRRSLGIVLQDTNLFTGTVMDNIRYGRLDATDEEVYEAAKIANAYDFITRLPEGFNTMLSGDGANLSQGQRQLLSIARAAVADAPVMILDEATSSIDTRTEKLVQKGMDMLMKGRTVFVIAHRLSTVQDSEAIMVLDHGRIIERGTHQDLINKKGVYYQLYTGAFELE